MLGNDSNLQKLSHILVACFVVFVLFVIVAVLVEFSPAILQYDLELVFVNWMICLRMLMIALLVNH